MLRDGRERGVHTPKRVRALAPGPINGQFPKIGVLFLGTPNRRGRLVIMNPKTDPMLEK